MVDHDESLGFFISRVLLDLWSTFKETSLQSIFFFFFPILERFHQLYHENHLEKKEIKNFEYLLISSLNKKLPKTRTVIMIITELDLIQFAASKA